MTQLPLDDDLLSLFERLDEPLQRTIISKVPVPELVALFSDMRLLRQRLTDATSPRTGKATDTWTRNGAERLAKIRGFMGAAQNAYVAPKDDGQPTSPGGVVIELVKARREAVWLVEFLDAYISSLVPDDDTEALSV